jgi:hypothetical protein
MKNVKNFIKNHQTELAWVGGILIGGAVVCAVYEFNLRDAAILRLFGEDSKPIGEFAKDVTEWWTNLSGCKTVNGGAIITTQDKTKFLETVAECVDVAEADGAAVYSAMVIPSTTAL